MDIRRYDIDSLRVLAFALLILVHVGNFLDSKDWLIKNSVTYGWLDFPQWFFSQWRLSLLFVVSGMGTYFNKPSRLLSYANEAVYPFYILHLVLILALGYYFKNVEMCFVAKFSIMTIGTFGITWLIYEFGIRRFAWIRPLFGMKRKRLDNMDKIHSNFI